MNTELDKKIVPIFNYEHQKCRKYEKIQCFQNEDY